MGKKDKKKWMPSGLGAIPETYILGERSQGNYQVKVWRTGLPGYFYLIPRICGMVGSVKWTGLLCKALSKHPGQRSKDTWES